MNRRLRPSRLVLFLLFLLLCLGGAAACGGGAAEPKSPSAGEAAAGPESEPASIEQAQDQIARARAALAGTSGAPADTAGPGADMQPKATVPGAETPAAKAEARTSEKGSSGVCTPGCRAVASMRRAVSALCRMTGDDDARCTDAKRTLRESEARVAPCGC